MPTSRPSVRAASRRALLWLSLLVAVAAPLAAFAQSAPDAAGSATPELSADEIALSRRLESLELDRSLGEPLKASLAADLAEARSLLEQTAERRARVAAFERAAAARESTLEALAAELATPVVDTPWPSADDPVGELAAATEALDLRLTSAITALLGARREETVLDNRASRIADEIVEATRRVDGLAGASPARETRDGDPRERAADVDAIRELVLRVRRRESAAAVVDLRRELATLPARQAVAAARSRVAAERVERLARALDRHESVLGDARVTEAGAWVVGAAERADAASDAAPEVLERAREELALARRRLELVRDEWLATRRSAGARAELVDLFDIGDTIDGIVDAGIPPDDLADLLRRLGERLPDGAALAGELDAVERARGTLQAERFRWNERLRERAIDDPASVVAASLAIAALNDAAVEVPSEADSTLASLPSTASDGTRLLVALVDDANRLSERLVADAIVLRESVVRTNAIDSFLERSLLGLRSGESAGLAWVGRVPGGLRRLSDAALWREIGATFESGLRRFPLRAGLFAALVAGLLSLRPWLRRRSIALSERVGHVGRDGFWVTPAALAVSALRALPPPLVLVFAGLQLSLPGSGGTFAPALGEALVRVSPVLFALLFGRAVARRDAVLHPHFGWSESSARKLGRHLLWLVWALLVAALPLVLALSSGQGELRHGVGVPLFLVVSFAIAAFVHAVFHPSRGIAARISPDTPTPRTMIALYPPLLLAPLAIGALPLAGYLDTAVELQIRVFASLLVAMGVALLHGLAARLVAVAHRRFTLRRVRRLRSRRAAERATLEAAPVSGDAVPTRPAAHDPVPVDVARVARQTRIILLDVAVLLLLLGLWLVWRSLFPAFGAADGIVLWRDAALGAGSAADGTADGLVSGATGGLADGVTLRNVVVALFLITVGLIASRNLRGLLELAVFERLRLDAGARYAIVAISGYVLVGTSLVAGLSQLGVDWSKLQWIVAALGVGLGFGLQEIVANFISGLIILFERPVRVGDVVTIGNLSGTISNIRIRATTVTDFDNLEVLLPNKTIITENVTNWTLSDSVTRLTIGVGVAYGSDIERVRSLLFGAIEATEDILAEPVPTVFFVLHGESALQFELRVFVATPAHRLPVTHELNSRIGAALAGAGIEIPFPQRSVHVVRGGDERAMGGAGA